MEGYKGNRVRRFKMKRIRLFSVLILFTLSTVYSAAYQENKVTVPLSFDYYYTNEMVVEALNALHKKYPQLTKLDIVGKSDEGRNIYAMTVNNPKTGPELDKPAIYVDGNIHGNEVQAGEVSLYLLNYLLTKYGKNDEITELVDKKCFYVIPVVNVDGRVHFFEDPNTSSSGRSMRRPHDDDRDGLIDEDFPDDLDGDGNICTMRKHDPFGQYKTDPEDPRLMIRVKPGEKGEWTILGEEGIDNDGDGRINEDSEGYVDGNRNWAYDWAPGYVQSGAGDYPLSSIGLKAVSEYIRKRPNICMEWAFHNSGGLFVRGPSTKAQGEYPPQDLAVYDYLGEQSERITPGYSYIIGWKDMYATYGEFTEWMMMINGAYGFVGELFMSSTETFRSIKEAKKMKPQGEDDMFMGENISRERERLLFNDHLVQGELYKPWKPYKHPTYGDIEIGGWIKFSSRLSAPFMLKDMVHRNASAIIFSAKHTPEVNMDVFETKKIGKNLYRIRTRLANTKAMPTMSYHAQKVKLYPKDMLTVSGKSINVVAGGQLTNIYRNQVTFKKSRPELQFLFIPGFGKVEHQFLVSGKGKVTIKYQSRHAGKIAQTITLK